MESSRSSCGSLTENLVAVEVFFMVSQYLVQLGLRCGGLGFQAVVKGLGQVEMGTDVCDGGWVKWWCDFIEADGG